MSSLRYRRRPLQPVNPNNPPPTPSRSTKPRIPGLNNMEHLYLDDLRTVYEELFPVHHSWYNIGLNLKVPVDILDMTRMQNGGDPSDCLRDMLKHWLKMPIPTSTTRTWRDIVSVLRSRSVHQHRLAIQLEHKLCSHDVGQAVLASPQIGSELASFPGLLHPHLPFSHMREILGNKARSQPHRFDASVKSDILPGIDTVGETQLIIETNKKSCFEWKGYGLKLHIPENALPQEVDQCTLNIRALLSGQFELPPEHILASAVYQIKASVKLARPVILEIQHCCSFENSDSTSLCFVVAHTKSELPYKFLKLEGGIFSSNYSYGSITLDHFCLFGIVRWLSTLFSPLYCAQLHCICQHITTDWGLHFGITRNLDPEITVRSSGAHRVSYNSSIHYLSNQNIDNCRIHLLQVMREKLEKEYPDAKVLVEDEFLIQFQDDEITLSIPEYEELEEGWEISCRHHPSITKAEVDSGCALGCRFHIHWMKQQQPVYFKYKVFLKGAKPSRDYFFIYPPLQVVGHSASEMAPLDSGKETSKYQKVAAKYDQIISTLSTTVSAETLADKLHVKLLIGDDIRSKVRGERVAEDKIRPIMEAILSKIELNPANYDKFIETLREFRDLEDLIKFIERATASPR